MKRATLTLASLISAWTGIAQDLPPGVLLLSRVRTHINEELYLLTTISCLETVQREHQAAKGTMRPLDTIRLEVLTNGDKELFASPGGRKFSENHPMSYAGSGTLGNGLFGPYLKQILVSGSVASQYKGEEEVGGRLLARYDYQIPVLISGQMIQYAGRVRQSGPPRLLLGGPADIRCDTARNERRRVSADVACYGNDAEH